MDTFNNRYAQNSGLASVCCLFVVHICRLWCWTLCQTCTAMWKRTSWPGSLEETWSTVTVSGYTTEQWATRAVQTWKSHFTVTIQSALVQSLPPQAIENFAVTVKTTAQMLQKFGTDLAETELPNDVQCTKDLLTSHTDKHDNLKVIWHVYCDGSY